MGIYVGGGTQVAASTPFDNSTNGFTSTDVQAAIEESRNSPGINWIHASSSVNMSSSTDAVIPSLTYTNSTGAAIKLFAEALVDVNVGSTGAVPSISVYMNGSQVTDTLYKQAGDQGALAGGPRLTMATIAKVILPAGQTIDIRWSVSAGTITAATRSLKLTRCGDF